jgi:hypothetical protein
MESSTEGRCGEIASDLAIILVTAVQLIFFAFFHKYIAWYPTGPDGTVTRLSLLTDDYFSWLPFPVTGSTLVIVASIVMIIWDNRWFRQIAWIAFNLIGITMVVSLLSIFPFDFSVIPNAKTAEAVPKWLTGFLIFMGVFYGISALVQLVQLIRRMRDPQGIKARNDLGGDP